MNRKRYRIHILVKKSRYKHLQNKGYTSVTLVMQSVLSVTLEVQSNKFIETKKFHLREETRWQGLEGQDNYCIVERKGKYFSALK